MTLLDLLQQSPTTFYGLVALVSLLVGSFLNVVIHRLPIMMERAWREGLEEFAETETSDGDGDGDGERVSAEPSTAPEKPEKFNLAVPRSRCPSCNKEITAWQNIPVLSYLMLAGTCPNCKTAISKRYPIVELVTMILSLIVAWQLGPTPQAFLGIVVTWFFVAMTMIDVDHQLLPDSLTLPLMWIGLLVALIPVFTDLQSAVVGAAAGYMVLWLVYQLFKLITGKEGMGYGDFKLLAAIGALLGWQALPVVILLSSLVGAVVGIALIAVTGRDKNIPIPFGPYLAAAGWIAMLWGDDLSSWYYGFLS
ncbi:prepilin peptidase [Granulosicoccus antarcticus]|uniref:Prepilin leader peptidase/N-methyltransferase n=1 Tax=Granulosicoccus antarcticus IMCC3135 TaxID=1192854 RepID=A0A2Z2P7R8_9GAMM|nr:A24 family peptidase [Granulosicoccus antarcticus]ASJ75874.1 Type 4 prepilin-like proteins leader peptide-processing enzyme [Granulosicoccus antarcticus IMCC3135]